MIKRLKTRIILQLISFIVNLGNLKQILVKLMKVCFTTFMNKKNFNPFRKLSAIRVLAISQFSNYFEMCFDQFQAKKLYMSDNLKVAEQVFFNFPKIFIKKKFNFRILKAKKNLPMGFFNVLKTFPQKQKFFDLKTPRNFFMPTCLFMG